MEFEILPLLLLLQLLFLLLILILLLLLDKEYRNTLKLSTQWPKALVKGQYLLLPA